MTASPAQRLQTVAITGGTFDPIHRGHVDTVRQVCDQIHLDHVHYIPASIPPHRARPAVSAEQRLAMVSLAIADYDALTVDDRELRRAGPSYTIDTLTEFRGQFPEASLILLLGLDAFLGLPTWHRWTEVLDFAHILVMNRPGWQQPDPLPDWWRGAIERSQTLHGVSDTTHGVTNDANNDAGNNASNNADLSMSDSSPLYTRSHGSIVPVGVTPIDASSTAVRERIAVGDMPHDLLHPGVASYIAQHQLYDWSA